MKKQLLSMLLIVAMVIPLIPSIIPEVYAESASQPIIAVEDVWAAANSTVEVNVTISDNPGLYGATLTISWAEGLTLIDAESGDVFNGLSYQEPSRYVSSGTNFIWYGTRLRGIQDGTVLKLTFEVAENVKESSALAIRVSGNGLTDADDNTVYASYEDGAVRIVNYIPGDTDNNDTIDVRDLVALAKYISDNCTTDPEGFNIAINEAAADVNDDGVLNPQDLVLIAKFISDGCKTDPDGFNVILKPSSPKCDHDLQATEAKAATCTQNGNYAYWYCAKCDEYFSNAIGTVKITYAETIIKELGHTVVIDPAVPPTYTTPGLTEGSHCSVCNEVFVKQEKIGPIEGFSITYSIVGSDTYLAQQIIENGNPDSYYPDQDTIVLKPLTAPRGYQFLGWYDAPQAVGGNRITEIPKGSSGNKTLYAHWKEEVYDITYKLYQTPLGPITEEKYLHYTVSKGLKDLPNPEIYNYVFLGWYTNDGKEVTEIAAGTTGDLTLNAYWTSKRNLTKAVSKLEDPIIIENSDDGVIYFTYELGTIENVPLSDAIWTIQGVHGLAQQQSVTVTTSISQEMASEIANTILESTVDSATWTLSKDWNDITSVTEEWANERGLTLEEANEQVKSESGTISVTTDKGGCSTTTETDGTTTVDYNSKNYTHGKSAELNAKIHGSYSNAKSITKKITGGYEIGIEIGGGYKQHQETDEHTGTDTTTVDSKVSSNSTSWNNSKTSSQTIAASQSESVKQALSEIISNTKGYGKSYSVGGENSEAQEFSSTNSKSVSSTSALTYFSSETVTTTTTYTADGKSDGCYRLVLAGTVHVFGVVGYDVATQSFFTYTFNVLDDKTYEFLDYSPTLSFDDYENGALPFEIPYFVHEYVTSKTVTTEGLEYIVDTTTGTATVTNYGQNLGTKDEPDWVYPSSDVVVPSYIASGGNAYKVTSISANAFAGKPIRSIILSDYIAEIPSNAFRDCTLLEQISGRFTSIGDNAFSGCVALEDFTVSPRTTSIGKNAFAGITTLKMNALNAEFAPENAAEATQEVIQSAIESGAKNVKIDVSNIATDTELTLNVPAIDSFEMFGDKKAGDKDREIPSFASLKITSYAKTTKLSKLTIANSEGIPLELKDGNLVLDTVKITAPSFVLLLAKDGASISLLRDSSLVAESGNAIVAKNPQIDSFKDENVWGTLKIFGNFYYCGIEPDTTYMSISDGKLISLTEEEFPNYVLGCFKVFFDPNGGIVDVTEMTAFVGQSLGSLPVPTRTGHHFAGWFDNNGVLVTETSTLSSPKDITLTAKWSAMTYTVAWNNGTGYGIIVNRTSSPYAGEATGILNSGDPIYYGDVLSISYVADTGYSLSDYGKTEITVTSDVTASDIYASASVNDYNVTWNTGTGYTIDVSRSSSPYAGAPTGALNNGATIYYGDVLTVSYAATNGYSLGDHGNTEFIVTNDIGSSDIYASATPNSYTYNISYVSSNGTNLGGTTVTGTYGTTETIYPIEISGYITPGSQTVTWDSTTGKNITFTYVPNPVNSTVVSGYFISSSPKITYSTTMNYRNRTANSVEVQLTTTVTVTSGWIHNGIAYTATCGSIGSGVVQLAPYKSMPTTGSSQTRSSGWITIPLNTTNTTSVSFSVYMYQCNSNWTDLSPDNWTNNRYTWTMQIPAF